MEIRLLILAIAFGVLALGLGLYAVSSGESSWKGGSGESFVRPESQPGSEEEFLQQVSSLWMYEDDIVEIGQIY
jgi:hypothetical protein